MESSLRDSSTCASLVLFPAENPRVCGLGTTHTVARFPGKGLVPLIGRSVRKYELLNRPS